MTDNETDIALMSRVRRGDMKAFELLVARHQRAVYSTACRILQDGAEAEDATQEVFLRVYRAAGSYTPDAKFTTWLFTIVKNLCFNILRKRKTSFSVSMDDEGVPEIASELDTPLEAVTREEMRNRVREAVNRLPENLRMAIILHKFQGLSCEEIADIFDCSVNAVKLRIHRAKTFLVQELGGLREET